MSTDKQTPGSCRLTLLEVVNRLKHDLGKYVAFNQRWLPPDCGDKERSEALISDVLQTRRSINHVESALTIWLRFKPLLTDASLHQQALCIDEHVLAATAAALQVKEHDLSHLSSGLNHAMSISKLCSELVTQVRNHG